VDETSVPCIKSYLSDRETSVPYSVFYQDGRAATKRLRELLGGDYFDHPKDELVLKYLFEFCTQNDDLVVDFFAGSGTTGHAIMALNKDDGGHRRYILTQLPEATDEKSEAYKVGYKKISDITIERVKRAGEQIHAVKPETDTGFKVFKLATSIFPENTYQPDPEKSAEENVQALKDHIARSKQQLLFDPKGQETDLMYETLVKQGFMLTMEKERLAEFKENAVWKVTDGDCNAVVCLDADLNGTTVKALARYKDTRFIGLHRSVDTTKKWELTQTFGEALVLI
jgi:adenine-specific DNA-methyltransferase